MRYTLSLIRVLVLAAIFSPISQASTDVESTFYLKGAMGINKALSQQDPLLNTELEGTPTLAATIGIGAYLSPVVRTEIGGVFNIANPTLCATGVGFKENYLSDVTHEFGLLTGYIRTYLDFPFDGGKFFVGGGPLISRIRETINYTFKENPPPGADRAARTSDSPPLSQVTSNPPSLVNDVKLGFNISCGLELPLNDDIGMYAEIQYNSYGQMPINIEATNIEKVSSAQSTYNVGSLNSVTISFGTTLNLN